jgi:hypothetical protein
MAKPAITKRSVKTAALTYAELDTNFQNLADATVSITAGTGGTQVTSDLNGNITLVAGTGVTLTGNNTAKTITITSSGGGGNAFGNIQVGAVTIAADSATDTLTIVAGTNISLTAASSTDTLTISSTGVSNPMTADLNLNGYFLRSGGFTNIRVDDDINFPNGTGPYAPTGELLVRGNSINLQTAVMKFSSASLVTPSNTTTPVTWLRINVNGSNYSVPLYQ